MLVNYACETNFSKSNLRGGKERGTEVLVGDRPSAERCKILIRRKVWANHPSQRSYRHPNGYLLLDDGSKFDLRSRTIDGNARYIFKPRDEIQVLAARLAALRANHNLADVMTDEDAIIYAALVLEKVDPTVRVCRYPDGARRQIWQYLPGLGVAELEALPGACAP